MDREGKKALKQVMPVVTQCLESPDVAVHLHAIGVLGEVARRNSPGKAQIVALLVEQAKAKDARVRASVVNALPRLRPQPKELQSILNQALEGNDVEVRRAALRFLSRQVENMSRRMACRRRPST